MEVREWQSADYRGLWETASRRYLDRIERMVLRRFVGTGRRELLCRILPCPELVDRLLGRYFGRRAITHQLFLDLLSTEPAENAPPPVPADDPLRIFKCTRCPDSSLAGDDGCVVCNSCGAVLPVHGKIYDFR